MVKITLEVADNGIIKTIEDSNINGAGLKFEKTTVYDFENDDDNFKKKILFLTKLSYELGIDLGNNFSKRTLKFKEDWGENYRPTKEEIHNKIEELKLKIKSLTLLESNLQENDKTQK